MYQVITIGSALVDILIHSNQFVSLANPALNNDKQMCFPYGEKLEMESFKVYSGGGASNTAVAFSRLGLKTGVICETGHDHFGYIVMREFLQEEVETSLVIREKLEQTGGSVVLVGENGGRTVMVYRGASSMLDPYDIPTYWTSQAKWIHLTSIAGRLKTLDKIFMLVKKNGIQLSWNPGKAELGLIASRKLDVSQVPCSLFFVNKREWQIIENIQNEILAKFNQVIITDGSNGGTVYLGGQQSFSYQAKKIPSVDDLGAGDAFASGYSAAILLGKTPKEAAVWGKANASSVIKYYGAKAGLLRRRQMESLQV